MRQKRTERREMKEPVWVLAVSTECGEPASVSIHPSFEAAIDWLRSGWDPDEYLKHLDGEQLIRAMATDWDTLVALEPCVPDWVVR